MSISSRIHDTIEGWQTEWKDRLRGWMVSWAVKGITDALEDMTPEQRATVDAITQKMIDNPLTPAELKALLEQTKVKGNPALIIVGIVMAVMMLIGLIQGTFRPLGNLSEYEQEKATKSYRLDPLSVVTAWRRDKATYEKYFDDLRDQGWSDERIEALKFITQFMPPAQDLVTWEAREVFEPAMIAKYGLDDEFAGLDLTLFEKIGVTKEQALNYWRAHWEHASWNQVVEMVRRGQMTEADVWDWFRLVEIPPFWRDKLIAISWAVPTRVDIRRFFDMRTIDEARLRELYTAQGYHGKDLDDYVLWTKIYVDLPDLLARWKNGWITIEEVKSTLVADGMDPDAADELIQTKVKAVEPATTTEGKDLTKAEIYKGVKMEIITYEQGLELLIDLGYSSDQAVFLLTTNVATLAGSPETFIDFKDMTQKYRKAAGLESQAVTEELKKAAAEVVQLTKDLKSLQDSLTDEDRKLIATEVLPPEATKRRDELRVALHRAESALAAAKSNYDRLVAEWRQKAL